MPHLSPLYKALIQPLLHLRADLAQLDPEAMARQTGFLRRSPRKIPIIDLLVGFCALASESFLSLERIASVIGLAAQCTYSKQSFHQRLPFFFSSRRRHTRLTCDWSSDVCYSD